MAHSDKNVTLDLGSQSSGVNQAREKEGGGCVVVLASNRRTSETGRMVPSLGTAWATQ